MNIGSWGSYTPPEWEALLDLTSDYTIEKTEFTRKQIEKLLTFLTEEGIIK